MTLLAGVEPARLDLMPGMALLPGRALRGGLDERLIDAARIVLAAAPARHMLTPYGKAMSAALSNCGTLGWISDRAGYRYGATDPESGRPWPAMPPLFETLAREAAAEAGFADFRPEACLLNLYRPGSRMGRHRDADEDAADQPIVSVSLGIGAVFRFGGTGRRDPTRTIRLAHGDIVVFGGPARFVYHGIDRLLPEIHPMLGADRLNLTFRRVTASARPLDR